MSDSDTGRVSRLVMTAAVLDDLKHPTTLLCAACSYPPEHVGRFELPGDKVEPAEGPEQAPARELDEGIDLGVRLRPEFVVPRQLAVVTPPNSGPGDDAPAWPAIYGFRMRVRLAGPTHPGKRGRAGGDHQRLKQVRLDPPDQLRRLPWLEVNLPIIDAPVGALGR